MPVPCRYRTVVVRLPPPFRRGHVDATSGAWHRSGVAGTHPAPDFREAAKRDREVEQIEVCPAAPARAAGPRVAAPPRGGQENLDAHTNGASRRRHALVGSADGTGTTLHKDRHPGQPMSVVLHN
jgi:hypothetical protein